MGKQRDRRKYLKFKEWQRQSSIKKCISCKRSLKRSMHHLYCNPCYRKINK